MTPEALRALAGYQRVFETEGFRFAALKSEPGILPYSVFSEEAEAFIRDAYAFRWVMSDFDWPEWAETPAAIRLRDDPNALAKADAEDLARLLTVAIRKDRFCEGELAATFESGLLTGICRRAAVLTA